MPLLYAIGLLFPLRCRQEGKGREFWSASYPLCLTFRTVPCQQEVDDARVRDAGEIYRRSHQEHS